MCPESASPSHLGTQQSQRCGAHPRMSRVLSHMQPQVKHASRGWCSRVLAPSALSVIPLDLACGSQHTCLSPGDCCCASASYATSLNQHPLENTSLNSKILAQGQSPRPLQNTPKGVSGGAVRLLTVQQSTPHEPGAMQDVCVAHAPDHAPLKPTQSLFPGGTRLSTSAWVQVDH